MTVFDYTEALISRRPIVVRRRVLWGECDPAAVVYTPRFAEYAASARDWFMREALGFPDRPHPLHAGTIFPLRAMAFDFRGFLAADDVFDMKVGVSAISSRTFIVEIVASHLSGAPAFAATLTSVAVDSATRKSVVIADEMRAALKAYSAPTS